MTGFSSIARICRRGRFGTGAAKLVALMLVIVLSVAVFILSAMLVIEVRIGFEGGEAPVQLLQVQIWDTDKTSYTYVPFNLSMRGYALVNAGLKCLALFAFAAFVIFITSFSNHIFGYISGVALIVWQYYRRKHPDPHDRSVAQFQFDLDLSGQRLFDKTARGHAFRIIG